MKRVEDEKLICVFVFECNFFFLIFYVKEDVYWYVFIIFFV